MDYTKTVVSADVSTRSTRSTIFTVISKANELMADYKLWEHVITTFSVPGVQDDIVNVLLELITTVLVAGLTEKV